MIALISNKISPQGIPLITKFRNIKIKEKNIKIPLFLTSKKFRIRNDSDITINFQPIKEINIEQAAINFISGDCIFFDARSTENYNAGHIPGAISVPIEEIGFDEIDVFDIDLNQKIITYCDGEECHLSVELATHLEELGFIDIGFFIGGWTAWIENNNQVSKGSAP